MKKTEEGFFKKLIDNINDGVYFLDAQQHITFWNKGAENIAGYKKEEVEGKHFKDDILNPVDEWGEKLCDQMCPVLQTLKDGKSRDTKAYIQHKEGYRIPSLIRIIPIKDDRMEVVGAAEIFIDDSPKLTMPQRIMELERMALLDSLTKVGSRRYSEIHLEARLNEMFKYRLSFGVLYIDIDQLQNINRTYGTDAGDRVLKMVSQTLSNNIRFFDFVGRWDDDEFVVVNTNVDEGRLDFIANKLRLLVGASNITVETKAVSTTISVGATVARLSDKMGSLVKRVQQLMLQSQKAGGNQVSLKPSP
jgi:diguanylate cyclase (GGDEF)-like protein/PAS domain S-box-containing protein